MRRYEDRLFNTTVSLAGLLRPTETLSWLAGIHRLLSRFDSRSDLSRLNEERDAVVSPALIDVLLAALDWSRRTSGLVTPLVGRELVQQGYDRSFEELEKPTDERGARPPRTVQAARPTPGSGTELLIDVAQSRVALPDGVDLDLGGFVKGWAADIIARREGGRGRGIINLGGDMRVWSDGAPWNVSISGAGDGALELGTGAVATSTTTSRRWHREGEWRHHIIDPRSSMSAASGCVEATVVADSALAAEVAAKYAVLAGIDAAFRHLPILVPGATWSLLDLSGERSSNIPGIPGRQNALPCSEESQ